MNEVIKNQWESKVWGLVLHVFKSRHTATSFLRVREGFRCSRHYHKNRVNQFTVLSGCIFVKEECHGIIRVHTLMEGDTYIVPCDVVHWFEVVESGEVVEVYWSDMVNDFEQPVDFQDIIRLDEGGPI